MKSLRTVPPVRLLFTCAAIAALLTFNAEVRAEDASAAELLRALVAGSVRGVEQGDVHALPALRNYLDLPPPWRLQVRRAVEASKVVTLVRERAAAGGADATSWQAAAAQIDALRGVPALASAARLTPRSEPVSVGLPAAVDGVQWLRIDGARDTRVQLQLQGCHPAAEAFALHVDASGELPGAALGAVTYAVGRIVFAANGPTAVRLDSSACSGGAPQRLLANAVPAARALPGDGGISPGSFDLSLDAATPTEVRLPTREGYVYEFLLAPVGEGADPGLMLFRGDAETAFATDDDGGYGLGSRAGGVLGDGRALRVRMVAVEQHGGPVSLVVRESAPERQKVGETRHYHAEAGAPAIVLVALTAGSYAMRTAALPDGVDTTLAVYAPGADASLAENDDVAEGKLDSALCIAVANAGDYRVQLGLIETASGEFDFEVAKVAACAAPDTEASAEESIDESVDESVDESSAAVVD